jgi:hypothetical protein
MVQTAVTEVVQSIADFRQLFGGARSRQDDFFLEWQTDLPELTDAERSGLDLIYQRFQYQWEMGQIAEGAINSIVVSQLLELAGFYDPPFKLKSEQSITVEAIVQEEDTDEPRKLKGRIDFVVFQNRFWQAVIESKETSFDIGTGIPQILTYMMGAPAGQTHVFGMVTNGTHFVFLKVGRGEAIVYDFSDVFSMLARQNCLYPVFAGLKQIAALIL